MRPWHLGNTTVRSPFRLRDGLVALSTSPLQGNLRGREQEISLRDLLGEHGIVALGQDETYSVGRKWRSALNKLGFLYPEVPAALGIPQSQIGGLDTITPNGWRLIRAETVPAMQECFLRALAAYYIPSTLERQDYSFSVFSPLRHTLVTMLELEKRTGESRLNFIEMALVVQLTSNKDDLQDIVAQVLDLRSRREKSDRKRQFDGDEKEAAAKLHNYAAQTFYDYADTNFRYLKATGLVQSKGRGISIILEKHVFIESLISDIRIPDSNFSYLVTLCTGAVLPTDNKELALIVLADLVKQLKSRNIPYDMSGRILKTAADIALVRYEIEELILERNEEAYAERQVQEWEEIIGFMELIISGRRSKVLANGEEIKVPQAEGPAYFEWVLWRAFLALNSLKNQPYDARRFKVDQDFLPVSTAPGNGPDLIFEFDNFVIAVEVTLTDNSRQEAAEGEPVRRHVADLMSYHKVHTGKQVYGLFIANHIDSNTAETFRIGVWYSRHDDKLKLDIVPFTLTQFKSLFETLFRCSRLQVNLIRELLDQCNTLRDAHEAPAWKREIEQTLNVYVEQLLLP